MSTTITVTSTSWITPVVRRISFQSDDLSAFSESVFTDRYVKLIFPKPGVVYPNPLDMRALRGSLPGDEMPDVRTYTALFPNIAEGTLSIDFVIHGDEGVAGPWAARAVPGDTLIVNGPGGAYHPDPTADWHLLVGDESALPAIVAALSALPPDAIARVVLEVEKPGHEPILALPSAGEAVFLYRDRDADGTALVSAIRTLDWPCGRVHAFVHGEAQAIMHEVRPYLFEERRLPQSDVSISGYWRRGRTEAGFREWKSALARREASAADRG